MSKSVFLVGDFRSPHSLAYLRTFQKLGFKVFPFSLFPFTSSCDSISTKVLFTPFNSFKSPFLKSSEVSTPSVNSLRKKRNFILQKCLNNLFVQKLLRSNFLYISWSLFKLIELPFASIQLLYYDLRINPDYIVAIRSQNEGYSCLPLFRHKFILFLQGSDYFYFAQHSLVHRLFMQLVLRRTSVLIADNQRDISIARAANSSLNNSNSFTLRPGNGGLDSSLFYPGLSASDRDFSILCPRVPAPYINHAVLFRAFSSLIDVGYRPKLCLLSSPSSLQYLYTLGSRFLPNFDDVEIYTYLPQSDLSDLLRQSMFVVSPSETDGIPLALYEAMACGAFPIFSNISSLNEILSHGFNGLNFNCKDYRSLSSCLATAYQNVKMRSDAQSYNYRYLNENKIFSPYPQFFLSDLLSTLI